MLMVEDSPELKGVTSFRKALFNKEKDTFRLMAYNAKLFIPSSSGGIQLRYDESQKFIQFDFSLPKFFFGNNVCELIPPMSSKRYYRSQIGMAELCLQYWYNAMKYAFKKILFDLTRGLENVKYWGDVQLFRWDIAFNQIFNSKHDAMHYLDSVGRVSAPRITDGRKTRFDNGNVTFQTENYYFKVYHKGTDFAHTGASQIRKTFQDFGGRVVFSSQTVHNKMLGSFDLKTETHVRGNLLSEGSNIELSMQQIDNLQSYSDRILRYEFEATSKYMSYAYNTRCAKYKMPGYVKLRRIVNYVARDENISLYNALQVRYRGQDGNLYKKKDKLLLFEVEYYLPWTFFDTKTENRGVTKVENIQTIKRIEKLLRYYRLLDVQFMLKGQEVIKKVHKWLESEKSKEHRFFFDEPLEPVIVENNGDETIELQPVKNAQYAIDKNAIPFGVHYDGPVMSILEKVPNDQRLTKKLMLLCLAKHNELFRVLQFQQLPEVKEIELLVKKYNQHIATLPRVKGEKRKQKMNVRQMKLLFRAFKHDTWDDIRRGGDVSRKTLYNWKKKCQELLGFSTEQNFISGVDLSGVARDPETLYSRHYDELHMINNPLSLFLQNTKQLLLF